MIPRAKEIGAEKILQRINAIKDRFAAEDGTTRWTGVPPVTANVIIIVTDEPGTARSAAVRVRI